MVCLACTTPAGMPLCRRCEATLRPAPDRFLTSGVLVRAAFRHEGAARLLVHRLKYGAVDGVAQLLAAAMLPHVEAVDLLVPVPRARVRTWTTGVDPAEALARALGRVSGVPVVGALSAPLWWQRHATRPRRGRGAVRFRAAAPVGGRVALVDDVVTTGATADAAVRALKGPSGLVLAATSAGRVDLG